MKFKKQGERASGTKNNRWEVTEAAELMKFLLASLPDKSRDKIKSILKNKQVSIDGKPTSQFNEPLKPGQIVEVRWNRVPEEDTLHGLKIVYEDDHLIVVDKEEGLLSIATEDEKRETAFSLLSSYVKKQDYRERIFIVHRLDRETSGLMVFARTEEVKKALQESWQSIKERAYVAIAEGEVTQDFGTITSYLYESKSYHVHSSPHPGKGVKAVTHFEVLKKNRDYTLLKVILETGRKNQIRVHLQDIGHPVIGDKKYGAKTNPIRRLGLHAWILAFTHPVSNKELRFESKMPWKFMRLF